MRREERAREHLDGPVARADRAASLADIDRLSAWFGGHALTVRALRRLLRAGAASPRGIIVADVGGGRGDHARRLVHAARRPGGRVAVVLVDRDPDALALSAADGATPAPDATLRLTARAPDDLLRVCADATALPFRTASVDVVTCSLTLHHLAPAEAVVCLASMRAAARAGVVINDLLRTRLSLLLVTLATRLFARHPISRHDGPLSVRRAYAPDELRVLCEKAGWPRVRIRRHRLLCRVLAVSG